MVQIRSLWFPPYVRNPQTYVANIFFPTPADQVPATPLSLTTGPRAVQFNFR